MKGERVPSSSPHIGFASWSYSLDSSDYKVSKTRWRLQKLLSHGFNVECHTYPAVITSLLPHGFKVNVECHTYPVVITSLLFRVSETMAQTMDIRRCGLCSLSESSHPREAQAAEDRAVTLGSDCLL